MPQLILSHTHSWSTVIVVLVFPFRHQLRHLNSNLDKLIVRWSCTMYRVRFVDVIGVGDLAG